jgi:predicted Zn-dependent protease
MLFKSHTLSRWGGVAWRTIRFHVLVCCSAQVVYAEQPTIHPAGKDVQVALDQMFRQFFGETESERQLLDGIAVSKNEEQEIGRTQLRTFLDSLKRQKIRVVERGSDAAYLKSLVSAVHPLMRNAQRYSHIRVYVADSTALDARAFPGGAIVCSKGLLDFAQSEAALIGVLAHELSHIDRGHQLRMVRSTKLAQGMRTSRNSRTNTVNGMLLAKQFARPFRPEDEADADLDAAQWIFEIGYDPMEMAGLFRRLAQRDPTESIPMFGFLRTHPYHAERYEAVKQLATQLRAANPDTELYVGGENLRKRIPRRIEQFPD